MVATRVVHPLDEVTIITTNGITMRTPVTGISQYGRMTRGVRIVSLKGDDTVAALAVMDHQDLQLTADGEAQSPAVGSQSMQDDGALNQDLAALDGDSPEMDAENPEPEIVAE